MKVKVEFQDSKVTINYQSSFNYSKKYFANKTDIEIKDMIEDIIESMYIDEFIEEQITEILNEELNS